MFAPSWRCGAGDADEAIALVRESLTRIRELHDKFAFVYALVPLAAAAVLKGDDAWAARILGARDAVTERTGVTVVDKSVHDLREQAEREVRARLGPDRWARAYAAGRSDLDRFVAEGHRSRPGLTSAPQSPSTSATLRPFKVGVGRSSHSGWLGAPCAALADQWEFREIGPKVPGE